MGWLRRQVEEHRCGLPPIDSTVRGGDVWQCDTCGTVYRVESSMRGEKDYHAVTPAEAGKYLRQVKRQGLGDDEVHI